MSLTKNILDAKAHYYDIAFKAMCDIGAIKCEQYPDGNYYNTYKYDKEAIYAIVTDNVKKENSEEAIDFKELHDQIFLILMEAATGPIGIV